MMGSSQSRPDDSDLVCVIGTGALGLVAITNLVEQGLKVQAFEKNDYVGGIWHASEDPSQTSVLPGTNMITSKQNVRVNPLYLGSWTNYMTI